MPSGEMSPRMAVAPVASLADFTSEALLVAELSQRNPAAIIHELSRLLQKEARVPDLRAFSDAVLKRESMISTAMDGAMAFPHARLSGLSELSFALGRSAHPISWASHDGGCVRLVFLIAVPAARCGSYLHLISGLARLSQQPPLRERLCKARDTNEMLAALGEIVIRTGQAANELT